MTSRGPPWWICVLSSPGHLQHLQQYSHHRVPVVTSGAVGHPEATTQATSGSLSESEALPSSHRGFSLSLKVLLRLTLKKSGFQKTHLWSQSGISNEVSYKTHFAPTPAPLLLKDCVDPEAADALRWKCRCEERWKMIPERRQKNPPNILHLYKYSTVNVSIKNFSQIWVSNPLPHLQHSARPYPIKPPHLPGMEGSSLCGQARAHVTDTCETWK